MKKLNYPIPYKDGAISIQASEYHYFFPKDDEGPYSQVEIAVCNKDGDRVKEGKPDMLEEWADDQHSDQPVYAYVPVGRVIQLLKDDGYTDENIHGIFYRLESKNM